MNFKKVISMQLIFTHRVSGFTQFLLLSGLLLPGLFFTGQLWGQACPPPPSNFVIINQVTDSSAFVNWVDVSVADSYIVEYGPEGFVPGSGLVEEVILSGLTLDSLNAGVAYEVYVFSVCGGMVSDPIGPYAFTTTGVAVCTYTFNLFDDFGDGWNGSFLATVQNGDTTTYTIDLLQGTSATYELEVISSVPVCISYSPGAFENEVSFEILDPNGVVLYSDGPDPDTGNILNFVACNAPCSAPKTWSMTDVNATNATTSWEFLSGYDGDVFLEYGPMGFQLGTGTQVGVPGEQKSFNIGGLEENTWYNVYLGVACGADSSQVIGPLVFKTLWLNDVGVTYISPNADDFCNLGDGDTITVGLTNFGQLPQTLFEFFYSVNGEPANIPMPQDGLFTGVVGNDSTQLIQFETTWDFSQPGLYVIEAWTTLESDSALTNDTFRVEFLNSFPKPIEEDFEDLAIPTDWSTDELFPFYPAGSHNNSSAVFGTNLYNGHPQAHLTSGRVGPVLAGDTLFFDYRFVDWLLGTTPTELGSADSLIFQISGDCEQSYDTIFVIDSTNHVPTTDMKTMSFLLDDYDGLTIHFRFLAKWGTGDYWLDIDNIRVTGCPVSFGPVFDITGATSSLSNDGSATVIPVAGTAPYTFIFSTGDTITAPVATVENLTSGTYLVDITDANGCTETLSFEVGTIVATDETNGVENITLFPNPTSGQANLRVNLSSPLDLQFQVIDLSGKTVLKASYGKVASLHEQLDLSNQPDGMYIVRIVAGGNPYFAKLMIGK